MAEVDENSTAYLTATFRDKAGAAAQPTSAHYVIHDVDSGEEIRSSTTLTVSVGVVEITLNKTDNTMQDPTKVTEIRKVTVVGLYGAGDEINKVFKYRLNNLKHVPVDLP